jgi:branched-subunit amino acid aminotransferase/4-amino-4-deoxychorismate lyase
LSGATGRYYWVDGLIMPRDQPVVRGDDSAFTEARGCYSTALITGGVARFAERHAARIERDAARLRIGTVERKQVIRALEELGSAAFPDGEGIVRVQASRDGDGELHLVGIPREIGNDGPTWSATLSEITHEGPTPYSGCKSNNRLLFALALDAAREAGADEALLFDFSGQLVEGARSAIFVVGREGALSTPPLERGGVISIAREVVMERIPQVFVRDVTRAELRSAEEIIAVNAVRGVRPITTLNGRPVGGCPSRWVELLSGALAKD